MLFELFERLEITITEEIALALYAGIVYDTGSFVYPKTTSNTFRIARALVEAGARPNYVFTKMYESNTVSSLLLQSMVMATLTLHFEERVAVQKMTKTSLNESGAPY